MLAVTCLVLDTLNTLAVLDRWVGRHTRDIDEGVSIVGSSAFLEHKLFLLHHSRLLLLNHNPLVVVIGLLFTMLAHDCAYDEEEKDDDG